MKSLLLLLVGSIALAGCNKGVEVNAPGVKVKVGGDGVAVDAPGSKVRVGKDGVKVDKD